jgi:hypothetical protein
VTPKDGSNRKSTDTVLLAPTFLIS